MGSVFVVWGDSPNADCREPKSIGDRGCDGAECRGYIGSHKRRKIEFHCRTKDGKSGTVKINGTTYDLANGSLFLVSTSGDEVRIKQLNRDMTRQTFDEESLTAFGKGDAEIVEFFTKSANPK
jgi:hypothetical protein